MIIFFPISPGRFRIIADLGLREGTRPEPTLPEVEALVDRRGRRTLLSDPIWMAAFGINERKVANYRAVAFSSPAMRPTFTARRADRA